jgi:hypothetical protein
MIGATSDQARFFATSDLQALADYVKFRLFATSVNESEEITAYDPVMRQFIGKLTTIQFIPAAIDYWDSMLASKTLTGSREVVAYRDHRAGLLALLEELTRQVEEEFPELFPEYPSARRTLVPKVSYGDNGRGILITPDPQEFPAMWGTEPSPMDRLPWRVVS